MTAVTLSQNCGCCGSSSSSSSSKSKSGSASTSGCAGWYCCQETGVVVFFATCQEKAAYVCGGSTSTSTTSSSKKSTSTSTQSVGSGTSSSSKASSSSKKGSSSSGSCSFPGPGYYKCGIGGLCLYYATCQEWNAAFAGCIASGGIGVVLACSVES